MANLITNKHKQFEHSKKPTVFQKRMSARRLRRKASADFAEDAFMPVAHAAKFAKRKRSGVCPVCLGRLVKNARGTRYVRSCSHCTAQVLPDVRCTRCGTFRVWRGRAECRCKGCGNVVL